MSGPYALSAFGDAIFMGEVDGERGQSTSRFVATAYQHSYGNVYTQHDGRILAAVRANIATLLPSDHDELQSLRAGAAAAVRDLQQHTARAAVRFA